MNRQNILRKVKACLRLAASSNPNEAAAALRQAQAMMRAHGISHAEAMDVDEAEVGTRCRGAMPPVSICSLAQLVADGFGSRFIVCNGADPRVASTVIRFYGCDGNAEVSAGAGSRTITTPAAWPNGRRITPVGQQMPHRRMSAPASSSAGAASGSARTGRPPTAACASTWCRA